MAVPGVSGQACYMTEPCLTDLLTAIEEGAPTGDDLEYDAQFLELERRASPKAERRVGDAVKPAEEPDWDKVDSLAQALLLRSKDLRIAVHLSNAWLNREGLSGFARGLELARRLLEEFWETVHPQLDAEDDDDPTARVNAVLPLASPLVTLQYLRSVPLMASPRIGKFSLRDLRAASGNLVLSEAPEGDSHEYPSLPEIEACCMDCDQDELGQVLNAATQAAEHAGALSEIFNEKLGSSGPDLNALFADLVDIKTFLAAQYSKRQQLETPAETPDTETSARNRPPTLGSDESDAAVAQVSRKILGPNDVIRNLDELCHYYAEHEPSSPVPLLLRRARNLVGKDFTYLLKDLAPGGLEELRTIVGAADADEQE